MFLDLSKIVVFEMTALFHQTDPLQHWKNKRAFLGFKLKLMAFLIQITPNNPNQLS